MIRLLFKQRFFSWFDSYDIYDQAGNVFFVVKGAPSWGHRLHIYNAVGEQLGLIQEEVLTFLPRFCLYIGNTYVGQIKKEFTFLKPRYTLEYKDWQIEGDVFGWDYNVTDGTRRVMHASKELFRMTDTYVIDIERQEDVLYSLMIVLAIDAANCSRN